MCPKIQIKPPLNMQFGTIPSSVSGVLVLTLLLLLSPKSFDRSAMSSPISNLPAWAGLDSIWQSHNTTLVLVNVPLLLPRNERRRNIRT